MDSDALTRSILEHILPFIHAHQDAQRRGKMQKKPFILGVTGLQGSGKSYIASALVKLLNSQKYMYNAAQVSLDDFYLGHHERALLRERNPGNELFKVRGQPGTHDADLALEFFEQLCSNGESGKERLWIPSFDKSLFQGDGDRLPRSQWPSVKGPLDILVFEGWCLGFQALPEDELISAATTKVTGQQQILPTKTLAGHQLEDLLLVNKCLRHYNDTFLGPQHFNFMVHLDTDNLANVYTWRLEQERELWRTKGTGMSDFQVVNLRTSNDIMKTAVKDLTNTV